VTGPTSFGGWDPFRPLGSFAKLWATPLAAGPGTLYRTLLETTRRHLMGRRFTIRTNTVDLTLTLTELDARLDPIAVAVGQFDDVRIAAENVRWGQHRIVRATALAHNVHARPAVALQLVAAPVELVVTLDATMVSAVVERHVQWLIADIDTHSVATLRLRRHPKLGRVEIDVVADGTTLWCRPKALHWRGWRWMIPAWLPAYPVRLPPLPTGLQLLRLELGSGVVTLHGLLSVWRAAVPAGRLNDLLGQVRAAADLLDFSGWAEPPGEDSGTAERSRFGRD